MKRPLRSARALAVLATAGLLATTPACSAFARKQWTVRFTTDGRIPNIGDRLEVEVLDESGRVACNDCARVFDVSRRSDWPISFGVADADGPVRIHARLFRAVAETSTSSARSIELVARLPDHRTLADSNMQVAFRLPILCFGIPPDIEHGLSCQYRGKGEGYGLAPEETLDNVGDVGILFDQATCKKPAPDGMACVGAGYFLMGDERFEALSFDFPARPEVPVGTIEDFAIMMDVDEMTVGATRAVLRAGGLKIDGFGWRGLVQKGPPGTETEACTYLGDDDPANDALPMNCIGQELAWDVCKALGKRLPYEYEWEFAAGNGVEETTYPWGSPDGVLLENGDDICGRAVVGRGRPDFPQESRACDRRFQTGPVAGGSPRDVSSAGVRNLGGNVSEWVFDYFAFYDDPCWNQGLDFVLCDEPTKRLTGKFASYRGGSWALPPQSTVAVGRHAIERGEPSPRVGFRCAITEDKLP